MAFKKEIELGKFGKLSVSEEAGVASVEISAAESVGGGQAEGVVQVSAGAKAQVDAKHIIDLGLELAAEKFPAAKSLIEAAKAGIDSELSKV